MPGGGARLPSMQSPCGHVVDVWAVRARPDLAGQLRDLALFNLAIDRKLRGRVFLFLSRFHASPFLSTRQCARLVRDWVSAIGLDPSGDGTHTLPRTKAALIYRETGNPRAVLLPLDHTKCGSGRFEINVCLTSISHRIGARHATRSLARWQKPDPSPCLCSPECKQKKHGCS